uniref:Hexosyltransferase n=1 Tax=Acrobeloides nanus TaxID=290746 RepID=A0A914C519_9BILA
MVYGARTGVPLGLGLLLGLSITNILFTVDEITPQQCSNFDSEQPNYVDNSEHWKVHLERTISPPANSQVQSGKVARARFAATELGIREKLIVIVLGQSTLSVALNTTIGKHVPKVHVFADISRIDADMSALGNLSPYKPNGQHAHVHILNGIFNWTYHQNYDWFFILPDTTYANPFELMRFVNSINWNEPKAIGRSDSEDKCILQAGILLSNPAMQLLIQQRHLCNAIVTTSDNTAFEMCIKHVTNLSCVHTYQGHTFQWWQVKESGESDSAIHDRVQWFSSSREFNMSLTVSPLLSELDVVSLHEHFVHVEISRIDEEIAKITEEIEGHSEEIDEGPAWPVGIPSPIKPPNRYQVPIWEYFTETEIFKNEPNQNVRPLMGNDALDIREIVIAARKKVEEDFEGFDEEISDRFDKQTMEFVKLRSGYRVFNALRGMEYVVDLEYKKIPLEEAELDDEKIILKRIHLCRPIHHTKLLHEVPYVKEDTDITLVVPVESGDHVHAARSLMVRHLHLCKSESTVDTRQTRLVIAVRSITAFSVRELSDDLMELKKRCKTWTTDTALLLLRPNNELMIEAAALDEAIDHFGQQMIYVLLTPHADYQREFLDRVRINTIRRFQVFFPIPFAEFNPLIVHADQVLNKIAANRDSRNHPNEPNLQQDTAVQAEDHEVSLKLNNRESLNERLHRLNVAFPPPDPLKQIKVHKDHGLFDSNDFSMVSLYGSDYLAMRHRFEEKFAEGAKLMDLSSMFLGQNEVHMLRAIEPGLRIRYHPRMCSPDLATADLARCMLSQKQTLGTKAQLANVVFSNLEELNNS